MPEQLLLTKLYAPPQRSKVVLRPRLVARLNTGLPGRLTLISAPAGFGKTTLSSEWAAGCGRLAAWLSLDEGEKDPTRFLTYLIAALQTLAPHCGDAILAGLQSAQPPPADAALTDLLNEISAIPEPFLVVLDDYHLIDSKPVDEALAFLLEHQPPQMHLAITTREDPTLPLARLRGRGQLTEVRASDLRFTPTEAAAFLNEAMGLNLSCEDIAALETRTEGWIAGLQMAALSMQGHPDSTRFIQAFTGSHRFVLDYLMEEVLERQPKEIQAFLLRTSILERMCGPLCESVMGSAPNSGQETLEYLDHANLFIVPLDNERRWYRYHHLFGDLLRQRLGRSQELPTYHVRASEWHEVNNNLAEAFNHALAAGDAERAARLAEAAWQGMDLSFQTASWLGWVKKLPHAVVCSRPRLCTLAGWAFSDIGDIDASETYLLYAEHALAPAMDAGESRSLTGMIALIRACNAQILGDLSETVKYAELAFQSIPEDDHFLRAQAIITLEFTHWSAGNLEAALRAMQAWMEDMRRMGNEVFAIASAFAVADIQVLLGRLGKAGMVLTQAIQLAERHGQEAKDVTAHHHLGLAIIAHERGDDDIAAKHLQTASELGQRTTLVDWLYRWNLAQARLKESAGEWDAALELIDEAGRTYIKNPIPILRPIEAMKARITLKQGRLDKATAWARERGLSVNDEVSYLGEYETLTLARVRLGEGELGGVDAQLERLLALANSQNRTASVIEILITQALVQHAQNNQTKSFEALERALVLGEGEGYLRVFVDEGEAMRQLLTGFRSTQNQQTGLSLRGYVDKILAGFAPAERTPSGTSDANQGKDLIEPLTNRELEILRCVADGNSNTEISQRLFLALSTVKGHNLRIFNKLQAQNRTEAVARARELGLL